MFQQLLVLQKHAVRRASAQGPVFDLANSCKYVVASACAKTYSVALCVRAHCLG